MSDENTPLIQSPKAAENDIRDEFHDTRAGEDSEFRMDWTFFSVALLGVFIGLCDESFVIATHDRIASSFQQAYLGPWLLSGYSLGYLASLPIFGRVSRIYGVKGPLLASYLIFFTGCAMIGFSPSIGIVVAGRIISGAGAAGMVDLVTIVINDIVPLGKIAKYRGYILAWSAAGLCIGGPLGGILASKIGWRWSFLAQCPIAMLCFIVAWRRISPKESSAESNSTGKGQGFASTMESLDAVGLFLLTIIMGSIMLLYKVIGDPSAQNTTTLGFLLFTLAVTSVTFMTNEQLFTKDPLVPLWLLRTNKLGVSFVAHSLNLMGSYGILINLTGHIVRVENLPEGIASVVLLPVFAIGAGSSLLAQTIIKRAGGYKRAALASTAIGSLCLFIMIFRWRHQVSLWDLTYILIAFFMLMTSSISQFVGISASSPEGHSSTVITVYYLCQQVTFNLTVTITSLLSKGGFKNALRQQLSSYEDANEIVNIILNDSEAVHKMPRAIQRIARSSFLEGFQRVPIFSFCATILAFILISTLKDRSKDQTSQRGSDHHRVSSSNTACGA